MKATGKWAASGNAREYAPALPRTHFAYVQTAKFGSSHTTCSLRCEYFCGSAMALALADGRCCCYLLRYSERLEARTHAHRYGRRDNPGGPLCTLVTAEWKTSPFLTESPLLVNQRSVAREQRMPCFNGGQSVGVCQ